MSIDSLLVAQESQSRNEQHMGRSAGALVGCDSCANEKALPAWLHHPGNEDCIAKERHMLLLKKQFLGVLSKIMQYFFVYHAIWPFT